MKILIVVCLMAVFGGIGYFYKLKLKKEYLFVCYLLDFVKFYNSNMTLFKNDVVAIIDRFLMNSNKTLKFSKVFVKKNNIYNFDSKVIEKFLINKSNVQIIIQYLSNIGKNEYEFEKEKNTNFEKFLNDAKNVSKLNFENKGSLYFKLSLAVGAVLCIIVW